MDGRNVESESNEEVVTLRESERLYRNLVERSNDGVIVLQDYLIKYVNPRFTEISGYSEEELLETTFTDHLAPEEIPVLLQRYRMRISGEPVPPVYETAMTARNGTRLPFELSAAVILWHGRPADLVWVRDITERKQAEEAVAAALEEARREQRRASALESIAEAALSAPRLPELLGAVVERIAEALNVDSTCVFVLDEASHEFEAHAAYNVPGLLGCRVRADEGLIGRVAMEQRPVYVADAEHDPLAYDSCEIRTMAKTMLGVPLVSRGRVVGVTRVQTLVHRDFSDDEIRLLQAIADRVAMAIDNAKLYDELERSRSEIQEALEHEKHFSMMLQAALLPVRPVIGHSYDIAVGYVPVYVSRQIGGDFYDAFSGGEGCGAVVIGDVSGKGLEAASLAATTRSTVHAFAHESDSPAEVLTRANSVLYVEQTLAESFVTVSLAMIDLPTGRFTWSSAGHPSPIVLRSNGCSDFLESADLPLAVAENHHYRDSQSYLDPGDKLILYTDGISEARSDGEMFDLKGIEHVISGHSDWTPEDIVSRLISAATEWAHGKLRDDAAVIVIERGQPGV